MIAVSRHVGTLEIDPILPQSEFCSLVHGYFTGCEWQGWHLPMGLLSCWHSGAQTLPHTLSREGEFNHSLTALLRSSPITAHTEGGGRGGHPTAQGFQWKEAEI